MVRKGILIAITLCSLHLTAQKFSNLAPTPPMGWNSWNRFGCDVSEKMLMEIADAMVTSGLRDAGYQYIIIDDCWQIDRDSLGFIVPDPARFPSGMKALGDYIHARGLKFGIYSCAGTQTCAGRPGGRGHEFQDAYMYAKWGVDYLKYDWCNTSDQSAPASYRTMRDALYKAGRPIVFSLCEWGNNKPWLWGAEIGHLWRTTGDIFDCFECEENHGSWSSWGVMRILDMQHGLRQFAGPDHWNDPDMLEVGNGGMSEGEDRAHFSMWCMLSAPLIAGNDLRTMSPQAYSILSNADAIAIDQDPLGIQAFKHAEDQRLETWLKPLNNDEWALCFLNRDSIPRRIDFDWKKQIITDELTQRELNAIQTTYNVYDVWTHKIIGTTKQTLQKMVPSHDVLMIRLQRPAR